MASSITLLLEAHHEHPPRSCQSRILKQFTTYMVQNCRCQWVRVVRILPLHCDCSPGASDTSVCNQQIHPPLRPWFDALKGRLQWRLGNRGWRCKYFYPNIVLFSWIYSEHTLYNSRCCHSPRWRKYNQHQMFAKLPSDHALIIRTRRRWQCHVPRRKVAVTSIGNLSTVIIGYFDYLGTNHKV